MSVRLSLLEVFTYLDASPASRNIREGEQLLNAGHILLCGLTEVSDCNLKIVCLCLQTSALTSPPHQLDGNFSIKGSEAKIEKFSCSCKAGMGGRIEINLLEKVSSTQIKCVWNQIKESSLEQYKPEPLEDFKCLRFVPVPEVSEEKKEFFRNFLIPYAPKSCLSIHRNRLITAEQPGTSFVSSVSSARKFDYLFQHAEDSFYMKLVDNICIMPLRECCQKFYIEKIQCMDGALLCQKTMDNPKDWQSERKYRITGSRCYGLYTYNGADWTTKSCKYFWPKAFTSMYTKHGLAYESEARNLYCSRLGYTVIQTGLLVHNKNSFLGYSPDGVVIKDGVPWKLLEIKCPFKGREVTAGKLIEGSLFLKIEGGFLTLKKKHTYYGQIQLGMAMLNVTECDFIVYAPFDKTFLNVIVQRDDDFLKQLLPKLKTIYFNEMLHTICTNKNNY